MVTAPGCNSWSGRASSCSLWPGQVSKTWWGVLTSTLVVSCLLSIVVANPEGDALIKMAEPWGVANGLPTWVPGGNPCLGWEGVTCDSRGFVSQLTLSNKGLSGPIPSAISSLTSLNYLDLGNSMSLNGSWNYITGDLGILSSLSNLQHLNLTYSYVGRGMPFPSAVLGLTGLITLKLDHAGFIGQFPPEISNLKSLQYLYLGNSSMTGPLPKELSNLVSLLELSLWDTNFNSEIPPGLHFCQKLSYLNLHNCGLWGALPPEFGNFKNMQTMVLYKNYLTGPVPDRWQNMNNLTYLRLDQNSLFSQLDRWVLQHPKLDSVFLGSNLLYGPFPNATVNPRIMSLDCNYLSGPEPVLNISVSNNCFQNSENNYVCSRKYTCEQFQAITANGTCPPCPDSQTIFDSSSCICHLVQSLPLEERKKTTLSVAIGTSVAAALVSLLIGLFLVRRYKIRESKRLDEESNPFDNERSNFSDASWEPPKGVQRFTFQELEKATGGFSKDHEIGVGGFGKVFYGTFPDGRLLAIKRASETGSQGIIEFRNEVLLLSRLHHKNLVRLEGFCEDKEILVYEYMSLGNLHSHLFRKDKSQLGLDSYRRLDIAVGIARALEYLHTNADPPVIHRDVKPSNVLLDESLTAKVSDFGISRASSLMATHVSTDPAGTAGYFDPQYFLSHQLTTSSDVYSFGVVLLELVTGQKAIDHSREVINLMAWAKPKLRRDGIASIVDPLLKDDYAPDMFFEMADLALRCTSYEKEDRPSMRAVLTTLEPLLATQKTPVSSITHNGSTSWDITADPTSDATRPMSEWSMMSSDSETGLKNNSETLPVSQNMVPR
ncbi:hypothetical protein M758_1G319400 [Ceratodon purpureus]|nr:hypothetical protein M758_1G319400 [Ceratodon purpureus]